MKNTEYYDVLGVDVGATNEEILAAFREKSRIFHPDKPGGSDEMMQLLNKIRYTLTDARRRQIYDQCGDDDHVSDPTTRDYVKTFFENDRQAEQQPEKLKCEPVIVRCAITLAEVCNGAIRELIVEKNIICEECSWHQQYKTCAECNGEGYHMREVEGSLGLIARGSPCTSCSGDGFITEYSSCRRCGGQRVFARREKINIIVAPGAKPTEYVYSVGDGHEYPEYERGDVFVELLDCPDDTFRRDGNNIHCDMTISLYEALCGLTRAVEHPRGETIYVQSRDTIQPGATYIVAGEGLPVYETADKDIRGDLVIHFAVVLPEKVIERHRTVLKRILGGSDTLAGGKVHDLLPSTRFDNKH